MTGRGGGVMTGRGLVQAVLEASPEKVAPRTRLTAMALMALGVAGLFAAFLGGPERAGWLALFVGTVLMLGLGVVGVLLSAIFQLTGARWGRAYRRLAEAGVALVPVGFLALVALVAGAGDYMPWLHEHPHHGGKALWLTRGFWDARVIGAVLLSYGVSAVFLYYSLRRDFCVEEVGARYRGWLAGLVGKGIGDPAAERERCEVRLRYWAPPVAIVYAVCLSLLGFDLIMALEPDWFSTLFGAWYFISHLFVGLALLSIVSLALKKSLPLERFLTEQRQSDLATLLFAFCLLQADFFWNQYLTIWYGNLPEETFYLVERTIDPATPWYNLSRLALLCFFVIPFTSLLLRKVKRNRALLTAVSLVVVLGIFLVRFIEAAPPILRLDDPSGTTALVPLLTSLLVFAGFLGAGLLLYSSFLTQVPIMPVGDAIFVREFTSAVDPATEETDPSGDLTGVEAT